MFMSSSTLSRSAIEGRVSPLQPSLDTTSSPWLIEVGVVIGVDWSVEGVCELKRSSVCVDNFDSIMLKIVWLFFNQKGKDFVNNFDLIIAKINYVTLLLVWKF